MLERTIEDGAIARLVLAVNYAHPALGPDGSELPLPSLADVRLKVDGPVLVSRVGIGRPVIDARKQLFIDPLSGKPWRQLADGTLQLLVYSTDNAEPIEPGQWLVIELVSDRSAAAAGQPVVASLVSREGTLAPATLDALVNNEVAAPLTVWPLADAEVQR